MSSDSNRLSLTSADIPPNGGCASFTRPRNSARMSSWALQSNTACLMVSSAPAEQHPQREWAAVRTLRGTIRAWHFCSWCTPSRNFVFSRRPCRSPSGHVRSRYFGRPRRPPGVIFPYSISVLLSLSSTSKVRLRSVATYFFALVLAAYFPSAAAPQFASSASCSRYPRTPFLMCPVPSRPRSSRSPTYKLRTTQDDSGSDSGRGTLFIFGERTCI